MVILFHKHEEGGEDLTQVIDKSHFKGILNQEEFEKLYKRTNKPMDNVIISSNDYVKIDIVTPWTDDFIYDPNCPGYYIWKRGSEHALCFDIRTNVDFTLPRGYKYKVPTGIFMALPEDIGVFLRERSGLANRDVCLGAGTLDADYRGEYFCLTRYLPCIDMSEPNKPIPDQLIFNKGDRICQAYFVGAKPSLLRFKLCNDVSELSQTVRGTSGFGSTGL